MGFKKILFGEKVPDKDDPNYKERYERDVAAGKSFAHALHLDKGAACVQRFASRHTKLFLAIIFAFVLCRSEPLPYDAGRYVPSSTIQCRRATGAGTAFQASSCAQRA